jgi:2-dehydropantoate 2-reductase
VLREPGTATLGFDLAAEAVAVGRAEGAALTLDDARQTLSWLQGLPEATPSSMLQDRLAGRSMEHEGLLGPVVTLGRRHGIPTPLTSAMLALLDALPHHP